MKTKLTLLAALFICISYTSIKAQNTFPPSGAAGIGTILPGTASLLDIVSTTKGILIPRMTKTQRDAIGSPVTGLLIFQTNSTPGFYYYDGSAWKPISAKGANTSLSNLSATAANADISPGTNNTFNLGASGFAWKDLYLNGAIYLNGKKAVSSTTDLNDNLFFGSNTGISNTTGIENIAIGNVALNQNQTGNGNVALGHAALFLNTASGNTAVGDQTMLNNTSGYQSCAFGYQALYSNTSGINNSAFGFKSLYNNSGTGFNGIFNSAFGALSLQANTTGSSNSAFGNAAMSSNSSGSGNVAVGSQALTNNTSGNQNIAVGINSLEDNTTGSWNTAVGYHAFFTNTAQDRNTAVGWSAGDGVQSAASTYLGFNAHTSAVVSGSMALGVNAVVTASNQVRIGTNAITSIGGYVNWSNISDGRYKKNIQANVPGLVFINSLKAVTYTLDIDGLDKKLNPSAAKNNTEDATDKAAKEAKKKILYSGFVAQDVEKTAKELGYDFSGIDAPKNDNDLYGLRYAEFVVPLVKAVQELSKENDELKKEIKEIKAILAQPNTAKQSNSGTSSNVTLEQNIPNPFRQTTSVSYTLPQKFTHAQIIFTDNTGKTVKQISLAGPGKGKINIDASLFASGTYSYSLVIDGKVINTKQMVFMK